MDNLPNNRTTQELAVGSENMNNLTAYNSNTPTVNIVGIENSPVHWRLASSLASGNANDDEIVRNARTAKTVYDSFVGVNAALAVTNLITGIWNPTRWVNAANTGYRSVQWNKGSKWMKNSEDEWLTLIGCNQRVFSHTLTYQVNSCTANNTGGSAGAWGVVNCFNNIDWFNSPPVTVSHDVLVYVNSASDGLFSDWAQTSEGALREYNALGVNHNEETNTTFGNPGSTDDTMGEVLDDLFRFGPSQFQLD